MLALDQAFKKSGEDLVAAHCYDRGRFKASGGTLATIFYSLSHKCVFLRVSSCWGGRITTCSLSACGSQAGEGGVWV